MRVIRRIPRSRLLGAARTFAATPSRGMIAPHFLELYSTPSLLVIVQTEQTDPSDAPLPRSYGEPATLSG